MTDESPPEVELNMADWHGKTLVDRDGEKIGKLEDVYVDVEPRAELHAAEHREREASRPSPTRHGHPGARPAHPASAGDIAILRLS